MRWIYAAVLLFLGTVWCQNDIPEDLQDLEKNFSDIPDLGDIPGFEKYNQTGVPSVENVKDAIKNKCEKNGGKDAFEKLGTAKDNLQACIRSNFNFTHIQEELDKSRKTGAMDEVFAKYCRRTPDVQECIQKFAFTVESCLEEEEKSSLKVLLNITDSLASFVCYKDGDRIAMFVADGGFECLSSKKEALEHCANETLGHRLPSEFSVNNLPSLVIDSEGCDDFANLQSCVQSVLETCEDNTPANIVDALFKYVRRITPCKKQPVPTAVVGAHRRIVRSYNNQDNQLGALNNVFEQVKNKYEPHCLKNGGDKAVKEFHLALAHVKSCSNTTQYNFKKKIEEVKGIPFGYLCKDFRDGIRGCLNTLTQKMEACSSKEEAYVPKFGIALYDSVFNFYCRDDARALKEFLAKRDVCMNKLHNSTDFCLGKTKHIKMYGTEEVVTKKELCGDLKIVRNCFLDIAAQQCSTGSSTNEFVVGLSDAMYAPCSGCDAMYAPCSGCEMLLANSLLFLLLLIKVINI